MEGFPTRSVLLEKRDEQGVMQEGFRFLDEKRLLLAAEAMARLKEYQALADRCADLGREAARRLREAVARHGVDGLLAHPAPPLEQARLLRHQRQVFGVPVVTATLAAGDLPTPQPPPVHPSAEARRAREALHHLLLAQAETAAMAGNLRRLMAEYRRTEQRARALEEVILPELAQEIHEIALRLEEMEQEDAVRVRLGAGSRPD